MNDLNADHLRKTDEKPLKDASELEIESFNSKSPLNTIQKTTNRVGHMPDETEDKSPIPGEKYININDVSSSRFFRIE